MAAAVDIKTILTPTEEIANGSNLFAPDDADTEMSALTSKVSGFLGFFCFLFMFGICF